jgi:type IV secretory pathway TraG/TraD family ATPase VirD4
MHTTFKQAFWIANVFIGDAEVVFSAKATERDTEAHSITVIDMRVDVLDDRNHSSCSERAVVLMDELDKITKLL